MRLLALLTVAVSARAVLLRTSGIYTLNIGPGLLLTHKNASSPVTAAAPASSSPDQAWSVIVDPSAKTATLQNVLTRFYVAESPSSTLTASNESFAWNFSDASVGRIGGFCAGTLCITLATNSSIGTLTLAPKSEQAIQTFNASPAPPPTIPPQGTYEIRNAASGRIISLFLLDPFLTSFPVRDRSGLWVVNQQGGDPSSILLRNYDSSGFLAVDGDNNVVGAREQYFWTVDFIEGLGQVLRSANVSSDTLTASPEETLVLGPAVDESSAWVFYPIDGNPFLP
ncbi:hypothetical protein AURDEDRAFT_146076 [Auricularia subglabra TFB-10046 SS5]|uniref:Ricin B lectin domain-containing protein n=1 Tax=Auricularia subglabra (strain TFB-10046 / SS5) TaxID=717982 RepID=J0LK67_AURST|nr:hypothetical protein AURDEDRAFT_146076 [Auricularia subglabra TFB-10046 SS5]